MSTLANSTLSHTYATVPTFTDTMIGYSASNNTLITGSITAGVNVVAQINITKPGIYYCEGNFVVTVNADCLVGASLSTGSSSFNPNTYVTTYAIYAASNAIQSASVFTITGTSTTLYLLASSGVSANPQDGTASVPFIKYTRIA